MRSLLPAIALPICLAAIAVPRSAEAQDSGTILVFLTSVGSEDVSTLGEVQIGLDACKANVEITFELDMVPSDRNQIDVYRGSDCNSTDRDDPDVGDCTFVTSAQIDGKTLDLEVPIRAAVLADAVGLEDCTQGTSTPTLWFLAVNDSQSNEDVGTGYGTFPSGQVTKLLIDNDPPKAPTDVTGGSGENQIPIEWDTDETDLEEFIVYIDSHPTSGGGTSADGGTSDAECGSALLDPGGSADDVGESVPSRTLKERSATGIDLTADDIDGDAAAVAIVAVDIAGNKSVLSEIACVEVVPTVGFWDRYREQGGDAEAGCRAAGTGGASSGALPVLLALLGLAWRSRRRA